MKQPVKLTGLARTSEQFFLLLLRLYPTSFRREFGSQMALLFRDCLRQATPTGEQGIVSLWLSTLIDVLVSAPRAHFEEWTDMQASYTTSSRIGAVFAMATALGFVVITAGFVDIDAPRNITATLTMILFSLGWLFISYSLYRRTEAVQPSLVNRASLAIGGIAFAVLLAGTVQYAMGNDNAGAWVAFGILSGLASLGLLGLTLAPRPEFGPWRFAPVLALFPALLLVTTWSLVWSETLVFTATIVTVLSLVGSGLFLWTTSGKK